MLTCETGGGLPKNISIDQKCVNAPCEVLSQARSFKTTVQTYVGISKTRTLKAVSEQLVCDGQPVGSRVKFQKTLSTIVIRL